MKKILMVLTGLVFLSPLAARCDEDIYRRPNNPADYVKLEKVSESKSEEMVINQPFKFSEEQIANMLRSLRYSRKALFGDKEKVRNVYEMEYIQKYTPLLVEAFSKASPFQVVSWSVVQKRPLVVLRNDRLTQVQMWVSKNELHIDFYKTEAQLQGDYQAHTTGTKMIENSKGLRIELDPQEGQKYAFSSTHELVLDINADWAKIADAIQAQDDKEEAEAKSRKYKKSTMDVTVSDTPSGTATSTSTVNLSAKDQKTAEQRLSELKSLKDKGLISEQDYNKKKAEILQGL